MNTTEVVDLDKLLAFAKEIVLQAGEKIAEAHHSYEEELEINEAHHHDLKIQLDVDVQKLLETAIGNEFPEHHILGEEGGEGSGGKGYEWILDPIDGTVNLVYGIPHFCVSVACRLDDVIQCGVIYDPIRKECFFAKRGGGAFCNERPITTGQRKDIKECILAVGFSKTRESIEKCLELYQYYGRHARKLRAMGSAALDMAYIACGRLDGYIEQDIKIWDIAAGMVILEEAGGAIDLIPHSTKPHHFAIKASNGCVKLTRS
ncbi:MAG: inositol monophosphatase family protein [Verrucomicrobiota bacterium]